MKTLMKAVAVSVLLCAALSAQDIVGRWSGVANTTDEGGTKRQEAQALEIKSENGKLVGSRGKTGAPFKVEQDGSKFNFYAYLDFEGGEHLRWKVELKDGKLSGTFSAMHDDPKKWVYDRIGAVTLTQAR